MLGTEYDWWVTGNNAYAQIPSLLPRIRTVLWLIIMEIEGHHSQWYTHFSSLSISPCPSLYFIADRKNNKCLKKEQMLKRLSWSYIYYNLCHGSTLFQPKTPYRQKREIFFFFFFFFLILVGVKFVWDEVERGEVRSTPKSKVQGYAPFDFSLCHAFFHFQVLLYLPSKIKRRA